jgi:hypothetical protein
MDVEQPSVLPVAALSIIDDTPHYELLAEELLVRINAEGDERFLLVRLRPYTTAEMKTCLGELKARVRDAGTMLIQEDANPAALHRIFDLTFLGLDHARLADGTTPSIEAQRAWLNRRPRVKARIANEAFATAVMMNAAEREAADTMFELAFDDCGRKIPYMFALYDPALGAPTGIEICHHFELETEADYQTFDRAVRRETEKRTGFTSIDIDYDALEKLYDRTILSIDGMTLGGAVTSAATKERWVARVPFWHKIIALNARFEDITKKNIA